MASKDKDGTVKNEKLKIQEEKQAKRLKKLEGKKVYLKTLIGILLGVIVVGSIGVYIGSHKTGIGWDEIESMREVEKEESVEGDGHLGGEEKLIKEEYENEISKKEFENKIGNEDTFYVYFYSPYCTYCNELGDEIIGVFKENETELEVLDVNKDVGIQESENIEYVPSVAYYEEGEQVELKSDVTREVLEELIRGDSSVNAED